MTGSVLLGGQSTSVGLAAKEARAAVVPNREQMGVHKSDVQLTQVASVGNVIVRDQLGKQVTPMMDAVAGAKGEQVT